MIDWSVSILRGAPSRALSVSRYLSEAAVLRFTYFGVCLAALVASSGCGGGSPFATVPVTGKVVFASGDSFKGYAMKSIRFAPNDVNGRVSSSTVQEDGTFALGTMKSSDGALPGKYSVTMTIMKNYPPAAAETKITWVCEPGEIEVKEDMEPVTITVSKLK